MNKLIINFDAVRNEIKRNQLPENTVYIIRSSTIPSELLVHLVNLNNQLDIWSCTFIVNGMAFDNLTGLISSEYELTEWLDGLDEPLFELPGESQAW